MGRVTCKMQHLFLKNGRSHFQFVKDHNLFGFDGQRRLGEEYHIATLK